MAPLKYPGAKQTEALGINDCGVIVGSWVDAGGVTHGFYGKFDDFVSFDYPEGIQTLLQGVNDRGTLVGSYVDASGVLHGLIATPSTPNCSI